MEDTKGTYVKETYIGDEKNLISEHVEIKFKHRKGENDDDSMSCFGRLAPNGETASLTQYLSWARQSLPTYSTLFTDDQISAKMKTLERYCDDAEHIARVPNAKPDETYTQDSELLLQSVEYSVECNMSRHFNGTQFAALLRYMEATMCLPLKPMMLFRNPE